MVIDCETTGLEARSHRIIEFGAVEIVDRRVTGNTLHFYINPQQSIDEAITEITGLTTEDLEDKPVFSEIAAPLIEFIKGAEIVAHNAPFDIAFLDIELARCGYTDQVASVAREITDTLPLARAKNPGGRNSLDALCDRYDVDRGQRKLHGALLDATLLSQVYLAMTSEQAALDLGEGGAVRRSQSAFAALAAESADRPLPVQAPSPEELEAHSKKISEIAAKAGASCLAMRLG